MRNQTLGAIAAQRRNKIAERSLIGGGVALIIAWFTFLGSVILGWVLNIIVLASEWSTLNDVETVLHIVGIIVGPLGVVMGWYGILT